MLRKCRGNYLEILEKLWKNVGKIIGKVEGDFEDTLGKL